MINLEYKTVVIYIKLLLKSQWLNLRQLTFLSTDVGYEYNTSCRSVQKVFNGN